jgi:molybdenum cofactor cytidylyltransferase
MTAAIILAAGESNRLGQPKQNLLFNGQTLLQRAVNSARRSKCKPVIVVLGANADTILPSGRATLLYNNDWKEGMASSIRAAINEVSKNNSIDKAIIMLCDQPFVSAELLESMIDKQAETGKLIVACTYKGTIGVPVLFERALFAKLLLLQGHEGAKKILKDHIPDIASVPFEQGGIDIDTPGDYEQLLRDKGY